MKATLCGEAHHECSIATLVAGSECIFGASTALRGSSVNLWHPLFHVRILSFSFFSIQSVCSAGSQLIFASKAASEVAQAGVCAAIAVIYSREEDMKIEAHTCGCEGASTSTNEGVFVQSHTSGNG